MRANEAPRDLPAAESSAPIASASFERLYEEYGDYLWRSLRLLGVPTHLLEDACQDSLVIIHRQLPSFEGRSTIKTWIWGIAERVAANARRTQRRKTAPLEPLSALHEPSVVAHVEAIEAAEAIERFCASLDDQSRALFVLAIFERSPAEAVAKALGLTQYRVLLRVRALRRDLKRFLEKGTPNGCA